MDQDEHEPEHEGGDHGSGQPGADGATPGAIDITQLAAKVHKLMQDELRLEKARGASRARNW
jgi:hypothetical protein